MINSVVISCLVVVCVFGSELKTPTSISNDNTIRIVGGHIVDIKDAPYVVSMQLNGKHLCGGTIIHKKFILTAAHCRKYPEGVVNRDYSLRIGSSYRAQGGNVVKITRKIMHPKYNHDTFDYDFAILELEKELNFGNKYWPLRLPKQNQDVKDGNKLYVYGWGETKNSEEYSSKLRGVEVPKVSQSACNKMYSGNITDRMICAGYTKGGKDACQSDSGGPLVLNGKILVGVVSWGDGCAQPNFPGVYGRVASVRNWIDRVIKRYQQ
ncbi:Peptidase S1, PA clan [Sergentomyia squamirostris]